MQRRTSRTCLPHQSSVFFTWEKKLRKAAQICIDLALLSFAAHSAPAAPSMDPSQPVDEPSLIEKHVVSAETHAKELQSDTHVQTRKEKLSAYFTIAAAAFGLIRYICSPFLCPCSFIL